MASDSWDGLLRDSGGRMSQMVQVGDGHRAMTKSASECFSREFINQHKPDDKHFLVHYIAMGAHEKYAANRNGDSFVEDELISHHPTFVSNGAYFREHKNNDKKHSIGTIKASAYNKAMGRVELLVEGCKTKAASEYEKAKNGDELSGSMACFPGSTLVQMQDGSEKKIADIVVGDKVRTHKGNVGEVSNTMCRDYTDSGVSFMAYGLPDLLTATAEHPIWIRPHVKNTHECPVCGLKCRQLNSHMWQKKDAKHQAAYNNFGKYAEGWRRADQLAPGDWVRTPFSTTVTADGDATYAALLGWYLAEGNVFDSEKYTETHWCVDFTLNTLEENYSDEIRDLLLVYGIEERQISVYNEPKVSRRRVRCRNVELMRRLISDGGKLAENKVISQEVMEWSPAVQKVILEKCLEGDGDWHKENHVSKVTTVSRRLAFQLGEIAWRNGITANITCNSKNVGVVREIKNKNLKIGPIIARFPAYCVSIPPRDAEKLNFQKRPVDYKFERKTVLKSTGHLKYQQQGQLTLQTFKGCPMTEIENGFVYRRIHRVKRVVIAEPVFDLTVPGDHGFVVTGVGVSNCKIAGDRCSCCDKFSKRTSEYCDHARNHMNRYLSEFGKYAFVFNPDPNFIDYSSVARPADRIARYIAYHFGDGNEMQKAASENKVITSSDWAEYYGQGAVHRSVETALDKLADACMELNDPHAIKCATIKAAFIRDVVYNAQPHELDDADIDGLRRLRPASLWYNLGKRACVLPFKTFCGYLLNKPMADIAGDAEIKAASAMLKDIPAQLKTACGMEFMKRMLGQFLPCCGVDADSDPEHDDSIDRILDKADDKFSVEPIPVHNRVIHVSVIKHASDIATILLPLDSMASTLALAYGVYKCAALATIEASRGESDGRDLLVAALS